MNSFIGEIRAFPYSFVPKGWLECNGEPLAARNFQLLFAVIGFTYGGDNNAIFNLPDLRGASIICQGRTAYNYYDFAKKYGFDQVTLTPNDLPSHNHNFHAKTGPTAVKTSSPGVDNASYLTNITYQRPIDPKQLTALAYQDDPKKLVSLNLNTISKNGASAVITPHENRSPYAVIRYCICYEDGDFPYYN